MRNFPPTTEMTTTEKMRDAVWRYWPDKAERWATAAIIAGAGAMALANWIRKGRFGE